MSASKPKPIPNLPKRIRDELRVTCALQGLAHMNEGNGMTVLKQYDAMFDYYHGKERLEVSQIKFLCNRVCTKACQLVKMHEYFHQHPESKFHASSLNEYEFYSFAATIFSPAYELPLKESKHNHLAAIRVTSSSSSCTCGTVQYSTSHSENILSMIMVFVVLYFSSFLMSSLLYSTQRETELVIYFMLWKKKLHMYKN